MISLADRRHAPLILVLLGLGLSLGFEFHRQKPLIWTPENSRRDFLAGVVAGTSVLGFSTKANADPRNGYYELANARLYDTARRSYLPADPALQRALPDRLAGVRCVVVGEAHTHPLHHRLELQVVEALHALADPETAPLAVGLEMFYRQHQAALDRYVFRGGTLGQLRRETDWDRTWGFSFAAYSKIFRYAQLNGIRLVGLNAPGALVSLVGKSGIDGLPPQLKELLPEMDLNNKQHKDRFMNKMQSLAALHGGGRTMSEGRLARMYEAQTLWDEYMAESVDRYLRGPGASGRLVVLAGVNHVEARDGIPDRVTRRAGGGAAPAFTVVPQDVDWGADGLPAVAAPPGPAFGDWVYYTEKQIEDAQWEQQEQRRRRPA
mmetsp:Transcript_20440/g.32085  ORF Transcript_20440/g.32085 Transcript_20440/m.32085 type:complete len:378 (-) Transcript_20440:571-1704(-)|eukprot:CAMPEP_0194579180 /NCGR_PEP_ID=MMETSP0292-20121207/13327_1 /TAXON_ID=39354 /ORGANISM="Heterosigma akashiwo, Strain CCMP2393" /LENGTH=377 /DNA_ID=CAMNT_0039432035 /DNA_START=102 /DNA_END=1235 /DNA_ORIENTATION=-